MKHLDIVQVMIIAALVSLLLMFFLFIVMLVAVLSPPGDWLGDICESIMRALP